jgi:ribonuclease BN (tRNA processing enzyme)
VRVVTVGTGTVVPDPARAGACLWVEHGSLRVVLDCGPGALQAMARHGLPWASVTHLALTHFHTDHLNDVPALLFALKYAVPNPRTAPLHVVGPVGTRELLARWARALGDWLAAPGFPLPVTELGPDEVCPLGDDATLAAHPTPHTDESVAYRLATPTGSLGYTGDTGASDALADFLAGVDLLVAECSLPDDRAVDHHLTPRRVAALARRARPRTLVCTHVYPPLRDTDVAAAVRAAGYDGPVVHAADGMTFDLA